MELAQTPFFRKCNPKKPSIVRSSSIRPIQDTSSRSSTRWLSLHRTSALVLIAYSVLHVGNHLASLHSVSAHLSIMSALRLVYRQPVVEGLLLLCVILQVASGLRFVVRGWAERTGRVAWLQAASGAYLAFFLLVHVTAVVLGRHALGLDTNFYFAAAGLHVPPYQWFFAPYYTLAVWALFAHVGCAIYWRLQATAPRRGRFGLGTFLLFGAVAGLAITLSLAGKLQPVSVPAAYKATYAPQWPRP